MRFVGSVDMAYVVGMKWFDPTHPIRLRHRMGVTQRISDVFVSHN